MTLFQPICNFNGDKSLSSSHESDFLSLLCWCKIVDLTRMTWYSGECAPARVMTKRLVTDCHAMYESFDKSYSIAYFAFRMRSIVSFYREERENLGEARTLLSWDFSQLNVSAWTQLVWSVKKCDCVNC